MKSKIKIDLDGDNRPVIRITMSNDTEDLKDLVLRRFFEGLQYDSNALFAWPSYVHTGDSSEKMWEIRPYLSLTPEIFEEANDRMLAEAESFLAKAKGLIKIPMTAGFFDRYTDKYGKYWYWNGFGFIPEGQQVEIPYPQSKEGHLNTTIEAGITNFKPVSTGDKNLEGILSND